MLLGAVTVLVVVTTADGAAPSPESTAALTHALETAIGPDADVRVRSGAAPAGDDALADEGRADGASLVGVVTWSDAPRRATLHFVRPAEGRWGDREIRFEAGDPASERGRTVGFALASMIPDEALAARREPPAPPAPTPAPAPAAAAAPSAPREAPRAPFGPQGRTSLEAAALVASAVDGYGGGVGAGFAVRLPLVGALRLRLAGGLRAGEVPVAQATSRTILAGAGLAWQPLLGASRRWGLGVRLDALVVWSDLGHLSSDDPSTVHASRFLPGLDAAVEGAYRFTEQASLVAAAGSEVALGRTDVVVHGRSVGALAPVRLLGEAGIRVSF